MNWYERLENAHEKIPEGGSIKDLKEDRDRQLAALWRLDAEMNAGGYIEFYINWGQITYKYVIKALENMGAKKHARFIQKCQSKIDKASIGKKMTYGELHEALSDKQIQKINKWTDRFLEKSEELPALGMAYYKD